MFLAKQSGSNNTIFARVDQERSSEANKETSTSVLFSPFCGSQGRDQGPSYHRPVDPEQILGHPIIQDGDSLGNSLTHSGLLVGMQNRPQGRLFSCSSELAFSSLSSLHDGRPSLCFPVSSFWPGGGSLGLHKDHQTGQRLPSQNVFQSLFFPGRLSSSSRIPEDLNKISASVLVLFKNLGFSVNKEKLIITPS